MQNAKAGQKRVTLRSFSNTPFGLQNYEKIRRMETIRIEYKGELRTECTHVQSGEKLITDAPIDNKGKGESFSPTDLLATAYGSCMLSIIGIYCNSQNIPFRSAKASVEKIVFAEPRRVGGLNIILDFSGNEWDSTTRQKIENAGRTCPVAKSIDPAMNIELTFKY